MTDFGRILEEWDQLRGDSRELREQKEKAEERSVASPQGHPRGWPVQDQLDLHGLNAEEAEAALNRFMVSAGRRGLRKVLIIHGKGNHSSSAPVLKNLVQNWLEHHPQAGMRGHASLREGGSGATWVILKSRQK